MSRRSNWELEQDPVWVIEHGTIMPSSFFRKWWEDVSEHRYGDRDRWIDAAIDLGYVQREVDHHTGKFYLIPVGFEYDPSLLRASLGISNDMPLVSRQEGNHLGYTQLWDWLLTEDGHHDDS